MSLPRKEFEQRMGKVRHLVDRKGLDLIFVYFDELNVMNGRYLTGWCPSVERGAVIVSNDCEPLAASCSAEPDAPPSLPAESRLPSP